LLGFIYPRKDLQQQSRGPAHVTVPGSRLSRALQVHHPVICLEKLISALGFWLHCGAELVSEAREEFA